MSDMENTNRLSYSQIRLYSECSQKYRYYYIDRIRETTKSGALLFGSAFDKAIEAVLSDNSIDEKAVFDSLWTNQKINDKEVYLPDSTLVVYAQSDMDWELLNDEDIKFINAKMRELVPELSQEGYEDAYSKCLSFKKQRAFRMFREGENKFLNICNWLSLRRKGHLMLETNRKEIMPKITKVIGTQVKIQLGNGSDSLIGFVDLVCEYEGNPEPIVFDYKTSASEYDEDAVLVSPQLTIYSHSLSIPRAGYFVFKKGIVKNRKKVCTVCSFDGGNSRAKTCTSESTGKRCGGEWRETIYPKAEVQILIDRIPTRTEDIVIENIDVINKAIHAGIFVRNLNACKAGYGNCPYLSLCFKNEMRDLVRV